MITQYASLAVFLLLVVLAAVVGSSFPADEWYFELAKPGWTPPPWLFGPVWSALYLMMALAAWRVWLTGHYSRLGALTFWVLQLALNAAWSWLFFGLERPGWAWMEMSLLIVLVAFCIRAFQLISRPAAYLMVPYLLWLLFAWFLNLSIWNLNGGYFARFLA